MGLLTRLAAQKRFQAQQTVVATGLTPMSPEFIKWFGGTTASGKSATEDTMMSVAAWWCCMRVLTESIGMLPWSMHRKVDERNSEQADDHWLQDVLIGSPNRDQDDVEFRETKTMHLVGSGNTYSFVERAGKRVTSLTPLESKDVEPTVKVGSNSQLTLRDGEVFFRVRDRDKVVDFPREKIWHVKLFGRNRLKGLSPLGAAKEAIGGALAMEEFGNRFFSQGAMPAGTVSYPGWLTKEQRGLAREALQMLVGGLGNAHKVALFEGGVKPEPWGAVNLEDLQFVVAKRFTLLEICRFHRVSPHMVGEYEKGASYASVEQFSQDFVTFTLMPYLTRFESSVTKWLLPPEERGKYFLRFNVEGLLRAASKDRAEFLGAMVDHGLMSRNEGRAKENLNRVNKPGMDDYTVQTALTPIDKLGQEKKPTPAAAPAADARPAVTANIVLPPRVEEDRAALGLVDQFVQASKAVVAVVRDIAARATEERSDLAERLAESHAQLSEGQERLAGALERMGDSHAGIAAGLKSVGDGLTTLARQEREVTVGGETFVSKPKD